MRAGSARKHRISEGCAESVRLRGDEERAVLVSVRDMHGWYPAAHRHPSACIDGTAF
jgi:hypothetical protein